MREPFRQTSAKDSGINNLPGATPRVRDQETIIGIIMVTMAVLLKNAFGHLVTSASGLREIS